jgi:hypothetical protein
MKVSKIEWMLFLGPMEEDADMFRAKLDLP